MSNINLNDIHILNNKSTDINFKRIDYFNIVEPFKHNNDILTKDIMYNMISEDLMSFNIKPPKI